MKKTKDLFTLLDDARTLMRKANTDTWRHYKGGIYRVIGFTLDSETTGVLVRYRRIDGPGFDFPTEGNIEWSRPLEQWYDLVPSPDKVDESVLRFVPVFKDNHYKTIAEADAFPAHRPLVG